MAQFGLVRRYEFEPRQVMRIRARRYTFGALRCCRAESLLPRFAVGGGAQPLNASVLLQGEGYALAS